jgi:hypothetical protein
MKFVSKFKLELPLAWKGLVSLGHSILLELGLLFSRMDKNGDLII